jgi:hypothetical protein
MISGLLVSAVLPNNIWALTSERIKGPKRRTKGGEWIDTDKNFFLKEIETPTRWTRLQHTSPTHYPSWPRPRNHWSASGPRNQQPTSRTRERSGAPTQASLTYTGQAGEHHRSDRSLLVKPETSTGRPLHRSGRCSSPVRPVQARKPPIYQTGLPSSKLSQTRNISNTGQHRTHPDAHPSKTQQESAPVRPVRGTDQTSVTWALSMNNARKSTHPTPTPDLPNRTTDLRKTLGIVGTPHGHSIAKI